MQDIVHNSYPFELVDQKPDHYKYDFVSTGELDVPKRVSIRWIMDEYYNLGFGDIQIDEEGDEYINDKSRNVNKLDGDRILCTALSCSLDFLLRNDDMKIVFFGNTVAKHRLYIMRLCGKVHSLKEVLILKGAVIADYKIKLDGEGFKVLNQINPDNIQYEDFSINNCSRYNFITFEIIK